MEEMNKWVAEFFVRRLQNPRVSATSLFSALNLVDSGDCAKLKITAVLRDISNSLMQGKVDEKMLDLLEILEKLLLQEQSLVTMAPSLKSAYCSTAVECTVRFMWPATASEGFFSEAVCRIWKKRIGILKERESDLVTQELLNWEIDLMKACEEPAVYQKIRKKNVRHIAMFHLNQLLEEQWALLGCSSLESEARKWFLKRKGHTRDNINEELGTGERRKNGVNPVGVDKVNDQEREPSISISDRAVVEVLKDLLVEIEGTVDSSTKRKEGPNEATPQADKARRTETRGGEDRNEAGTSSRRVRRRLPTWKPLNVSPLKKGRVATPGLRRKKKYWSTEEIEALREGVKVYGTLWKLIKNSNPAAFVNRTEVDMKDKWRNLVGGR